MNKLSVISKHYSIVLSFLEILLKIKSNCAQRKTTNYLLLLIIISQLFAFEIEIGIPEMTSLQRSRAIFSIFLGIVSLICWADARRVRLSPASGTFFAPKSPGAAIDVTFVMRARSNELISVQVDVFDALEKDHDTILFQDGKRRGVKHIYKKRGEHIVFTRSDNSNDEEIVTLPFTFHSTTKRLFINYYTRNQRRKQGFVARYEKYPNNLCTKSSLMNDTTQLTCTQYNIAPTAANCSYVKDCPANFVTWRYAKCVKKSKVWNDATLCIADPIQVEQCDIDDEGVVTICDYSLSDIANYYAVTDESDDWENFDSPPQALALSFARSASPRRSHSRASGKKVPSCRRVKRFRERKCSQWRGRNRSVCMCCRYKMDCKALPYW